MTAFPVSPCVSPFYLRWPTLSNQVCRQIVIIHLDCAFVKRFSRSFRKGQKTHFALAGLLDINGDGRSDQTKLKSIIT